MKTTVKKISTLLMVLTMSLSFVALPKAHAEPTIPIDAGSIHYDRQWYNSGLNLIYIKFSYPIEEKAYCWAPGGFPASWVGYDVYTPCEAPAEQDLIRKIKAKVMKKIEADVKANKLVNASLHRLSIKYSSIRLRRGYDATGLNPAVHATYDDKVEVVVKVVPEDQTNIRIGSSSGSTYTNYTQNMNP